MQSKPKNSDYQLMFANPISGWHRWYAWRPVDTVDRGYRWLIPVWRRRVAVKSHLEPGGGHTFFQHAVEGSDEYI